MMTREQIKMALSVPGLDPAIKETLYMVLTNSDTTFDNIQMELNDRLNSSKKMRSYNDILTTYECCALDPAIKSTLEWILGLSDVTPDNITNDRSSVECMDHSMNNAAYDGLDIRMERLKQRLIRHMLEFSVTILSIDEPSTYGN